MLIDQVDRHKKMVLLVLLLFTVAGGFIFTILNLYRGQFMLSLVEAISGLVSLIILIHVRRTEFNHKLKQLALIYVVIFFSVMMFAFASHGVSVTIFVWALIIPSISYLLLGVRTGFVVTVCFLTITTSIYLSKTSAYPAMQETVALANVIMSTLMIWGLSHTYEMTNQRSKNKLQQLAIKDYLTGLYNRSVLGRYYSLKLLESIENQQTLCLILFDLDRFKSINDHFGHSVGDEVLVQFAKLLKLNSEISLAFRIGGEEFALLLPCTTEADARNIAEKIRFQTQAIVVKQAPSLTVSVSIGLTVVKSASQNIEKTLKMADDRLYLAKEKGRNRVIHEG